MRRIDRLLCLLFTAVSLSACTSNAKTFVDTAVTSTPLLQATSISTDSALPLMPPVNSQAGTPTLSDGFSREGLVLAGHVYTRATCYDLAIYQDGHYSVVSCQPDFAYPTPTGFLDEYKLAYLHQWVERFQSFDGPASTAFLKFMGNGVAVPEFSDMVSMEAMLSDIEWDAHGYVHKGGWPAPVILTTSVLSKQLGIPLDHKSVLKFDVVDFPDSCLGLPRVGEVCLPGVKQGFRIQLVAQGLMYEFHTDSFGYDIRPFGEPQIAPTPGPAG